MPVSPSALEEVADALRAGRVVLLPTDTVYGLAVEPTRPGAVDRLFRVKERPADVPIPVLAADADQAFTLVADVPEAARLLAARLWPGGLTMVLPRRPGLGFDLGGTSEETIGLRVPADEVVRNLARELGPLATTSANRHGHPTPPTAAEVLRQLGAGAGLVAAAVDDGPRTGSASTVVLFDRGRAVVRRPGAVTRATIEAVLGTAGLSGNSSDSSNGSTIHDTGF